jgi:hypothetical protein
MRGSGRGILLTETQSIPAGLDWAAVIIGSRAPARIEQLRAAGVTRIYVWDHPRSWRPDAWEASLSRFAAFARQYRLTGIIVDTENGWTAADRGEAARFGSAIRLLTGEMEVGVTTFPGSPILESLASTAGPQLWALVQIYNRGANDAATFRTWFDRVRRVVPSTIPLLATWVPAYGHGSDLATEEGYSAYLGKVPTSYGFATYGAGPSYMMRQIANYRPALSSPVLAPVLGFLSGILPGNVPLPVLVTVIVFAVLAIAAAAWWTFRRI